ncbi:hypothetical protein G9A89_019478 [Geosiphon pyriformis]|nr:hypothetical protein G9A89_019478 [Geosiphon pyriformis]
MSWSSEVKSENASVSKMSDLENISNIVAKKTSYIDSDGSEANNMLPSAKLHGLKKRSFEPVKLFTLDIEIAAISEKNLSLNKAKELVICKKILVNNNVRKLGIHSNQEIIVKEIPVDLFRSAVESVFSKFNKVVLIKMQLIDLWQKALVEFDSSEVASSVVALAVEDKQSWVLRNQHRVLLYTLSVDTTAHDLSGLLDSYGRKTCFIGRNLSSYVHDRCAVICFTDETSKLAAIGSVSVFKSTSLQWAGLFLACCTKCKQFGHISDVCSSDEISGIHEKWMVTDQDWVHLAGIYKKKQASIAHPVSFGGKTWAQVTGGFFSCVAPLVFFGAILFFAVENSLFTSALPGIHDLYGYLVSLECSLELLADQISGILVKLGFLELVPLAATFDVSPSKVLVTVVPDLDLDMVLDDESMVYIPSSLVVIIQLLP